MWAGFIGLFLTFVSVFDATRVIRRTDVPVDTALNGTFHGRPQLIPVTDESLHLQDDSSNSIRVRRHSIAKSKSRPRRRNNKQSGMPTSCLVSVCRINTRRGGGLHFAGIDQLHDARIKETSVVGNHFPSRRG